MDIVIEVAANAAFVIGFFFGPALVVEAWKSLKA